MICIYHQDDFDGKCSAALIKKEYPKCELRGMSYNDLTPTEVIFDDLIKTDGTYDTLFMVDFSYPKADMEDLHARLDNSFVWIDHHKTAIDECQDFEIRGIRSAEGVFAACRLVWGYLYGSNKTVPWFVRLLSDYDVWYHKNKDTVEFQYGMKAGNHTDPENQTFWLSLYDQDVIEGMIQIGSGIMNYQAQHAERIIEDFGFEYIWHPELTDNRASLFINYPLVDSMFFEAYRGKYPMCVAYYYTGKNWIVSIRTDDDIDVGKLARSYGGGGHKRAAGFTIRGDSGWHRLIVNAKFQNPK